MYGFYNKLACLFVQANVFVQGRRPQLIMIIVLFPVNYRFVIFYNTGQRLFGPFLSYEERVKNHQWCGYGHMTKGQKMMTR